MEDRKQIKIQKWCDETCDHGVPEPEGETETGNRDTVLCRSPTGLEN